ncbi:MAG: TrbG/VirB9 family P-type conjugative transfer protein [Acidobacteria bacterium]|nr:TrbG/VirB9 family P-type conjugative transfer protein [Acidobacteriota bacterium]
MKRFLSLILICSACAGAAFPQQTDPPASSVVHVATALNHLTILEFHEPVTMAAAGSSDFQIERQENKVFVKPMKSGASTDLFVWTASRRFAYELETTQEVKNMNFAIDNAVPTPAVHLVVSPSTDQLADLMLTRAFLGTVEITSVNTRPPKNQVGVRVEQVFRTRSSVYIHYTIENNSKSSYHVAAPSAYQVQGNHSSISLSSLAHKQLDPRLLGKLVSAQNVSLPIAHAESAAEDLAPGEATQGVVAIRQDLNSPAIVHLVFEGGVKATFVL